MKQGKVLFVDDDEHIRNSISQSFDLAGIDYECFASPNDMLAQIFRGFNGVVISDIRMQPMDGIELLNYVQNVEPQIPVILITGHGDVELAVNSLQNGAYDFFEKPYNNNKLHNCIEKALDKRALYLKVQELLVAKPNGGLDAIIGDSRLCLILKQQIKTIATAKVDILINGATGTGKELVARTLHTMNPETNGAFVAINCGALPSSIIESELFGHEKGAFTGATSLRIGKFEYAKGGTVFLDEIESMPLDLQVKLLRVLQERSLERLGSNKLIDLDIRIIAASKKDLFEESQKGNFREDLYYRLNVATINIPSLDARKDDIALLAQFFIENAVAKHNIEGFKLKPAKILTLVNRKWPGNVRELRNYCERIVLGLDDLNEDENNKVKAENTPLSERMKNYEKLEIIACLTEFGGQVQACCNALALPRKTFYDKLTRYGLNRMDYE